MYVIGDVSYQLALNEFYKKALRPQKPSGLWKTSISDYVQVKSISQADEDN